MSSADDQYELANDAVTSGVPAGDSKDNDYVSRTGQSTIPVQKDEAPVEDPIDPATADSDETLGKTSPFLTVLGFGVNSYMILLDMFSSLINNHLDCSMIID